MQGNLGQYYLRIKTPYDEAKEKLEQAIANALEERYPSFTEKQKSEIAREVIEYLHHDNPQKWWTLLVNANHQNKRGTLIFSNIWNRIVDHCDEEEGVPQELRGQGKVPMPKLPTGKRGGDNVITLQLKNE
jgi:hypothetical protein